MSRKYCNVKFHPENRVPGDITIVPPRGKRVKIPELTKQTLHVTVRGCWSLLLKTLVNVRALQGQKAPGSDTLLPPHQKLLVTIRQGPRLTLGSGLGNLTSYNRLGRLSTTNCTYYNYDIESHRLSDQISAQSRYKEI